MDEKLEERVEEMFQVMVKEFAVISNITIEEAIEYHKQADKWEEFKEFAETWLTTPPKAKR